MNNKKIFFAIAFLMLMILMLSAQLSYSQGSVRAWSFSGVNSYVKCDSVHPIYLSRQTIEAWIKIDDFTGKKRAIYSNGNDYNLLVTESAGSYYIEYWVKAGGTWLKQKSKTLLKSNTWYHIAAAYDGYSISILLNGNFDNKGNVGNSSYHSLPSTYNNYIGASPDTQFGYFTGVIDEIRIWSTSVLQSDIHSWMRKPLTDKHPDWDYLQEYFKCDETVLRNNHLDVNDSKNHITAKPFNITSYGYPHKSVYAKSTTQTSGYDKFYFSSNKTIGIYFNNKIYQFYKNTQDYGIMLNYGNINSSNQVEMDWRAHKIGTSYLTEGPGCCVIYKNKLIFAGYDNNYVYYHISDSKGELPDIPTAKRLYELNTMPAMAVLNDTLYFFYVTGGALKSEWSVDGKNYNAFKTLKTGLSSDYGNLSACKSRDKTGKEVIFIAYPDAQKAGIHLLRFYRNKVADEKYISVNGARNVSVVAGSVEGDTNSGNILQIFYSSETDNGSGCANTIGRIEYSIDNQYAYAPEIIKTCAADCNTEFAIGDLSQFMPYAFPYYQTTGSAGETLGQKIVMTVNRADSTAYSHSFNIDFFTWNSDKMTYIPEADVVDTNPDDKISQLLGVIEGPPPYVLNGDDLGELIKIQSYPSFLEFGSSSGQNNEKTVSVDKSWDVSFRYEGLGGDFEHHAESATQTEYSSKSYESRTVFPVEGRNRGYLVFLRPIITRKKFQLTDANNNIVDNVYSLEISDRFIDYVPYYLDTVAHAPDPKRLDSYKNRDVDLESYTKIYSANYSWTGGTKTTAGFETDNSVTKSTSEEFYKGFGISVSVDVGYGEFVEVSTNVFNFESHIGTTSKHEGSTTISNSRNISVNTECPFNGLKGDTAYFSAIVYWIKPTDGKINWWVPKGYEKHKPWCITYTVNNSFGHPYTGLDDIKYSGMFEIYPNPANDFITIDIKNQNIAKLEAAIYNIMGQSVYSATINTLNTKINISNLDDGIYFLKLTGKNLYATEKILIRH